MIKTFYNKVLGINGIDEVTSMFLSTLINTNRTHEFFVDWGKIINNINKYKIEFSILDTLIHSKKFNSDLNNILNKYPEVLPVIPILIAARDLELNVINEFSVDEINIVKYDFSKRKLNDKDISKIIYFFEKTGLKSFFLNISQKSIYDYVSGVEVGMDTNARKNRSGIAMELIIEPILNKIRILNGINYDILNQVKFSFLNKQYRINVSESIFNRKADFILVFENNVINIEVNFFSGGGSKPQEIVDSYINRQKDLKENGFHFIWLTDGYGWSTQENQTKKAFREIDYLLNIHFINKGLLNNIIKKIYD